MSAGCRDDKLMMQSLMLKLVRLDDFSLGTHGRRRFLCIGEGFGDVCHAQVKNHWGGKWYFGKSIPHFFNMRELSALSLNISKLKT